jgi:arylsulfatase A-like enzyme
MVHVPLAVSDGFKGRSKRGLYGDAAEEVDWSVGQIVDALKRLGLDDNTMVVFTSDNGPWLNKKEDGGCALPLREGKGTTHEGGVRVPMVVRWPGHVPAGTVCESAAMNMDLLPTLARLAGTTEPTDRVIDGKDIWPLMTAARGSRSPHDAIFYYRGNRLEAVRWRRWKLRLAVVAEKRPMALYDLESDISESQDVAASFPKIVQKLEEMAEKCREDLGDSITGRVGKNCRRPGTVGPSK